MNRGVLAGVCVVLLLAVLIMVGIVAGQSRREPASTSINAVAVKSWPPASAGDLGRAGVMTMSPVTPVRAVSPRPPSSSGPVAVRVVPTETTAPTPPTSTQNRAASASARIKPRPLPSIVLVHNGLPEGVPYAGVHDPIRIASVTLSADEVRGGDIASARVITTSNAAALTARIGTYQVNVPRIAPGVFSIAITVPHLPVRNQLVDIIVTAIRSDGATARTSVPLKVSF